ncbi:lytic transglycosylase domain-containing protein [Streptomyces sp. HUCO-GS316]|uniref:lytic transglycosylase domain-containing protein n=1 Tax=Streptomyces sp. HUCO-GS316 TaxID=2692198 RepID=UPI0013721B7A|nr:lytic transglycosylase domain-containing protein [Streptomyces sp. HUCO-GS316]MXM61880.1 lytic transglycosylase domain-containing protein [Streptomyces sp. HUCO-GS316]
MGVDTGEKGGAPVQAPAQKDEEGGSKAVRNTAIATGGAGCLLFPLGLAGGTVIVIVFCGFGVLLAPLIAIYLLFHGGGGGGDVPGPSDASSVLAVFQGDGQGDLDTSTVPEDLAEPIQKAGELCGAIGPIVIASQLEKASGFNASLVGPDGKQGISQLPPDVFTKYGKDDDDNGKTSALDAKDSIMAQGRYMCDLADQAQKMIDANEAAGSVLDLALAGYGVGMDAVRAAKGVPNTNEAQGYVAAVRAQFAKYAGVAAVPSSTPTPSGVQTSLPTAVPTGSLTPSA